MTDWLSFPYYNQQSEENRILRRK